MGFKKPEELLLLLIVGLLCVNVQGSSPKHYDFVLEETNFTRLCSTKSMLVVNGSYPGPVIEVHKGETIFVNVHNRGRYGVTIHWHGVKQPRNPWSDGPEYVTQCPINPGTNFTYEVVFSTEEGTLWWHAHSDWTRTSVHGAIVIKPAPNTTFPFPEPDGDKVVVLASWYIEDVNSMVVSGSANLGDLLSDANTINGQPGDFKQCSKDNTYRFMANYGETYLLRMINAAMNRDLFVAVANHTLTVVGLDGGYVKPVNTDYLFISTGQTLDVLVKADQEPGEYYMIASPYYDGTGTYFDNSTASAIFQYSGNYTSSTTPIYPAFVPDYADIASARRFVTQLRGLGSAQHPIDVPLQVNTRMFITLSVNVYSCSDNGSCTTGDNTLLTSLNNMSFVNPDIDILEAYYSNISGVYEKDFPDYPPMFFNFTGDNLTSSSYIYTNQTTAVKVLNYNESVEIVFQGTNVLDSAADHPIHLHGFKVFFVGSGYGNFDNETSPSSYNLIDPPEANTVMVPKDGWATIRFRANNPGVWFMHCHFERHLSWGMNTAFIVKSGGTPETTIQEPPAYMPPCNYTPLLHQVFNTSSGDQLY